MRLKKKQSCVNLHILICSAIPVKLPSLIDDKCTFVKSIAVHQ